MNKYQETFKTWDKIAELYQNKFMELDIYDHTYDCFSEAIQVSNPRLLDIGCGPGNISKYLLSKRPDLKIHGIDVAPNMVSLASENNPMASFEIMDVRRIDQLESTYDGIICGFCIPYLSKEDVSKLFKDCNNLLNESGILYVSFVEGDESRSGYITGSSGDRSYFYYHNYSHLKSLFLMYGFKEYKMFKVPFDNKELEQDIHTILVLKK